MSWHDDAEREITAASSSDLPALAGELAHLQALTWQRLNGASSNGVQTATDADHEADDRLLTVDEAAQQLDVKPGWLYRHADRLPFTRKLSRKMLRFSERGLRRWRATRRP